MYNFFKLRSETAFLNAVAGYKVHKVRAEPAIISLITYKKNLYHHSARTWAHKRCKSKGVSNCRANTASSFFYSPWKFLL